MFRLTLEREKRSWSKSELGIRSGVALVDICRLEARKIYPYPGWRKKQAAAFGVDENELFEVIGDGDQTSAKQKPRRHRGG